MAINQDKKKNKREKKQPKFLIFTALALQMGVLTYLGAALGKYLDAKFPDTEQKWFTIFFTLLALVIAFYFLIKKVNQLNEKEDD